MGKTATIIIDPGHGGQLEIGGSSANNSTSVSGVLEKNIALRMALLVRDRISQFGKDAGHAITVVLTRDNDSNLGLRARANKARDSGAALFLSIHCNASEKHNARGTETLISPINKGNTNYAADRAFAQAIQNAVFNAIRDNDPNPMKSDKRGVKDQSLGVLRRSDLGPKVRACMVELEFIDFAEVDALLNIGPNSPQVREAIAVAIAKAVISSL